MNNQDISAVLIEEVKACMRGVEKIDENLSLQEQGMGSLQATTMQYRLMTAHGITVELNQLLESTVIDLIELITGVDQEQTEWRAVS